MERIAGERLLDMLPAQLRGSYAPLVLEEDEAVTASLRGPVWAPHGREGPGSLITGAALLSWAPQGHGL